MPGSEFWDAVVEPPRVQEPRIPGVSYDEYGRPNTPRFRTPMDFVRYVDSHGAAADPGSRRQAEEIRRNPEAWEVKGPGLVTRKPSWMERNYQWLLPAIVGGVAGAPYLSALFGGGGGAAGAASSGVGGGAGAAAPTLASTASATTAGMPFYVPGMGQALPASLAAENALFGGPATASLMGGGYNMAPSIAGVTRQGGQGIGSRILSGLGRAFGINRDTALPMILDTTTQLLAARQAAEASNEAARIQAEWANKALAMEQQRYDDARANFAPFLTAGQNVMPTLSDILATRRVYGPEMEGLARKPPPRGLPGR